MKTAVVKSHISTIYYSSSQMGPLAVLPSPSSSPTTRSALPLLPERGQGQWTRPWRARSRPRQRRWRECDPRWPASVRSVQSRHRTVPTLGSDGRARASVLWSVDFERDRWSWHDEACRYYTTSIASLDAERRWERVLASCSAGLWQIVNVINVPPSGTQPLSWRMGLSARGRKPSMAVLSTRSSCPRCPFTPGWGWDVLMWFVKGLLSIMQTSTVQLETYVHCRFFRRRPLHIFEA